MLDYPMQRLVPSLCETSLSQHLSCLCGRAEPSGQPPPDTDVESVVRERIKTGPAVMCFSLELDRMPQVVLIFSSYSSCFSNQTPPRRPAAAGFLTLQPQCI